MGVPRRRRIGSEPEPVHSFRCSPIVWAKALRRAKKESATMTYVIQLLLQGYGDNAIDLPKVVMRYGVPADQALDG